MSLGFLGRPSPPLVERGNRYLLELLVSPFAACALATHAVAADDDSFRKFGLSIAGQEPWGSREDQAKGDDSIYSPRLLGTVNPWFGSVFIVESRNIDGQHPSTFLTFFDSEKRFLNSWAFDGEIKFRLVGERLCSTTDLILDFADLSHGRFVSIGGLPYPLPARTPMPVRVFIQDGPGNTIPWTRSLSLWSALMRAGGFSEYRNRKGKVLRGDTQIVFNVKRGDDLNMGMILNPGDWVLLE